MKNLSNCICASLLAFCMSSSVLALEVSSLEMDDNAQAQDMNGDSVDDCVVFLIAHIHAQTADSTDTNGGVDHFAFEAYDGDGNTVTATGDVRNYLSGGVLKTPGNRFATWFDMGINVPIFLGNSEPVFPYELKVLEVIPGQSSRPVLHRMTLTQDKFEEYRSSYCQNVPVYPKTATTTTGGNGIKDLIKRPIKQTTIVRPRDLPRPTVVKPNTGGMKVSNPDTTEDKKTEQKRFVPRR